MQSGSLFPKNNVCRIDTSMHFPLQNAQRRETKERTWIIVVSCIAYEDITSGRVHSNAIGYLDRGFGTICDEVCGQYRGGKGVDDGKIAGCLPHGIGEVIAYHI